MPVRGSHRATTRTQAHYDSEHVPALPRRPPARCCGPFCVRATCATIPSHGRGRVNIMRQARSVNAEPWNSARERRRCKWPLHRDRRCRWWCTPRSACVCRARVTNCRRRDEPSRRDGNAVDEERTGSYPVAGQKFPTVANPHLSPACSCSVRVWESHRIATNLPVYPSISPSKTDSSWSSSRLRLAVCLYSSSIRRSPSRRHSMPCKC
jgi:hypothetical protein